MGEPEFFHSLVSKPDHPVRLRDDLERRWVDIGPDLSDNLDLGPVGENRRTNLTTSRFTGFSLRRGSQLRHQDSML